MSTLLTIESVCRRGFKDAASLTQPERFLYLLADLETLRDMEGWDDFFTTDRMRYYHDLITGLEASGDSVSVEILRDYERHFSKWGVAFEPAAISKFLSEVPDGYVSTCRDWQSEFELAKEDRWNKVEEYLKRCGYEIVA